MNYPFKTICCIISSPCHLCNLEYDKVELANVTPHVAQNTTNRSSALDERTTRHGGSATSLKIRKRLEECFGWLKTVGGLRTSRFVGREKLEFQFVMSFAAFNLLRMRNLGVVAC